MLDQDLIEQLRGAFASLASTITLRVRPSDHEKQGELVEMAGGMAQASPKVVATVEGDKVATVLLEILRDGTPTGIAFRAVPGGHEFTSLVLAVLNADGKGKLPDEGLRRRIANIQGPIALRTYMSLSCTNCPDVVQALNLMALLNPSITHEVVDGGLAEAEISALGVQAVPSVFAGDKLISVGKASFAELVAALENAFGSKPQDATGAAASVKEFDVVVIGGGPAGAAAAIYTARKGLRTAIVAERMGGQLQDTLGIENMIGTPYTEGPKLAAELAAHIKTYPIEVLEHRRVDKLVNGAQKELHLQGGEVVKAPALVVATGAKWRELNVPGEKQYLGRGVAFCPHCDGPFYKDKPVAVIGGGNSGVEAAIDLSNICSHVTLVEFSDALKADAVLVKNLQGRPNVAIITNAKTTEVLGDGAKATGLRYQDRATETLHDVALDGVFVQIGLLPNSGFIKDLVETNRFGEIVVDGKGRTNVPGIYAAGDVTTEPFKQIVIAMGKGSTAALTAFEDSLRA